MSPSPTVTPSNSDESTKDHHVIRTKRHVRLRACTSKRRRIDRCEEEDSRNEATRRRRGEKLRGGDRVRELVMSWPDAFLLLETETKDPPVSLQEKEKRNKNEGNECGGLRVASLRYGVFADRGGRAIY
ncbi:hypothetical protein ALC53_11043 [Atta colombica]|uniref:Uncharacterized protein n=1 Tax=Atta colombica TaxID=520822 RepID=A0A195B1M0_9HYME|nr:hypothetical protein ALC53_11043 [Atta colombica]